MGKKSCLKRNQSAVRKWMDIGQSKYLPMWNLYSLLPNFGYKIYTFKFNDPEFLFQLRGCHFLFRGFHLTTPKNSNDCSDQLSILTTKVSSREKKGWDLAQPSEEASPGALVDVVAHMTLLKSRWSNFSGPSLLVHCLNLGVSWVPTINQGACLPKKCTVHYPKLLWSCCPLCAEVKEGTSLSPQSLTASPWCWWLDAEDFLSQSYAVSRFLLSPDLWPIVLGVEEVPPFFFAKAQSRELFFSWENTIF